MEEIRIVEPKFAKGSREEKFHKIRCEFAGTPTYYQTFVEGESVKIESKVENPIINEYGGVNHVSMLNDMVTITKVDERGAVKEKITKHIDEF